MLFSSSIFLFLFLPIVLALYYFPPFKNRTYRNVLLFLASLGFYAWGEPVFVLIMLVSIVITWLLGKLIEKANAKKTRKTWVVIGSCYHIFMLFVFKYLTFLTGEIQSLFHQSSFVLRIALPLGISFFTFQLMSYLFDVYYEKVPAQKNVLYVGLYVSFFPQLIAGPIVRYVDIEQEIINRQENWGDFKSGVSRFIYGLAKKVLLADYLGYLSDLVFQGHAKSAVLTMWIGAIAYTLQIYFDFSGYSDMAIGLGRMFGFHFSENFNYPYISKTITEFWRRWHISLSSWFRDYVYIPLGGNRKGNKRQYLNLFVVWALTGIWHGANWTFLMWGLIYYVALVIEKALPVVKKNSVVSRIYTLLIVVLAWVIFNSVSVGAGVTFIGKMFGIGATGLFDANSISLLRNGGIVLLLGIILSMPVFKWLESKIKHNWQRTIMDLYGIILFALSIFRIVGSTYSPFIYFNF